MLALTRATLPLATLAVPGRHRPGTATGPKDLTNCLIEPMGSAPGQPPLVPSIGAGFVPLEGLKVGGFGLSFSKQCCWNGFLRTNRAPAVACITDYLRHDSLLRVPATMTMTKIDQACIFHFTGNTLVPATVHLLSHDYALHARVYSTHV